MYNEIVYGEGERTVKIMYVCFLFPLKLLEAGHTVYLARNTKNIKNKENKYMMYVYERRQ